MTVSKPKGLLSKVSMWSRKQFETQSTHEENAGRESSQTKNQKIKSPKRVTRLDKSLVIVDLRAGWCIPPGYIAALRDTITGRLKSICESKHVVDQRSNVQKVESQKREGGVGNSEACGPQPTTKEKIHRGKGMGHGKWQLGKKKRGQEMPARRKRG